MFLFFLNERNASKSFLVRANRNRSYQIFEKYVYYLPNKAQQKRVTHISKLSGNVYVFDSTVIDCVFRFFVD